MGISLNLTNFQDGSKHSIPTFHWSNLIMNHIQEKLMGIFDFHFTSHGLEASSDDDVLWHFFMATDDTIFSPKECEHLTNVFKGLHIPQCDSYLQGLKHSFQIATQWKCSLAFQIVKG